jgi:hypothetical protein
MEMLIEYCLQHFDKGGVAMLLVWMYFIHRDVKSNQDHINIIKNNHLYHIEKDIAVLKEKSKDL